jgi:type I site-specific restriction endonuclease
MGGRGSGGGRGGGGGAAKTPNTNGMNKEELINLYNSISGNPAYTVEQRVKTMHDIKERIDELDAQKAADTKQKRLDALAKARAKRAENLKNGIKPEKKEKKPRQKKAKMSMDSTVSDLKYNLRRGVESDGYISNSDFRVEDYGNSISVQIRYLGKWKNPSHARYEEDYDWQELRSSSRKQIDKVVKKLSKQSGRKISWGASEKNWIDIDIPKMKGD